MTAVRLALAAALVLAAAACGGEEAPFVPPAPSAAQVEQDLAGQRFAFYEDADGARDWTIEAAEIRGLQIRDTTASDDGQRLRVLVDLSLVAPKRSIRGTLELAYARVGDGWQLDEVNRAGPNFTAGDAAFLLFDVRPIPGDSLAPRDRLVLDVIARFADGEFQAPFDVHGGSIRALMDSSFASDSLRAAATRALERRIAERWLPGGLAVRLLARGQAPRAARLDSAEVSFDGCQYLAGWTDTPATGSRADLATTSTILGGTQAPGRALTSTETRALDRLARDRLALQGLDGRGLRLRGTAAADLDGDGRDELIAAYGTSADETERGRGIVVAARPNTAGVSLLFERFPAYGAGFDRLTLIGLADLDADGAVEAVFREEGYEVYQYLVVSFRAGRFTDAFRGGGGGC
jgi:hypothetical protein